MLFPRHVKVLFKSMAPALLALLGMVPLLTQAAAGTPLQASAAPGDARAQIERFLLSQTTGLAGKVGINIDTTMSAALPPCAAPEPFLPAAARLWGRVSVGVRCHADQPWTRYVSTYVAVVGAYYVAARPISAGQELTLTDIQLREGDLTRLPGSVVVDPAQLNGVIAANRIASGSPLRRELLRPVAIVQRGQSVKVLAQGAGFVVSSEGKAMTHGAAGAMIQVKMQNGQLLGGIVRPDGTVQRPP